MLSTVTFSYIFASLSAAATRVLPLNVERRCQVM
jgi:hypothetical protein